MAVVSPWCQAVQFFGHGHSPNSAVVYFCERRVFVFQKFFIVLINSLLLMALRNT